MHIYIHIRSIPLCHGPIQLPRSAPLREAIEQDLEEQLNELAAKRDDIQQALDDHEDGAC